MARFLLRRLIWAIPTLLGISIITFAMIHLAPGDPVDAATRQAGGAVSRQATDATRRLFFFDLPLFYNPNPRGLQRRLDRLLGPYLAPGGAAEKRARALEALRGCGTVCLPGLLEARATATAGQRTLLVGAIDAIRTDHRGLGPPDLTGLPWAKKTVPLLADARIQPLTAGLGSEAGSLERLRRLGSAALPATMAVLLDGRGRRQTAAAELASTLAGVEGRLADDPAERERMLAFWSEWWFQQQREHVRFSWWKRLHGRITETQFAKWLGRVLTFRFGASTHDGRPVLEKLAGALPVTLLLSLLSMVLAYLIAVPLGIHAAVRQGTLAERLMTVGLFVLYSLPSFWVAMVLILLFGGVGLLDWFPIYGLSSPHLEQATGWTWFADRVHHLVLPVACLTYGSLAVISRYQRSAMLEVIRQDYIRTARAKGLSERAVIFKHALRNSLLPVITLAGLQFPYLISGSVIIERIFNIPGMGMLTFDAFLNRDYPVIMAVSVLSATMTLAGLILSDVCYALVDPRISLERSR